MISSFLESYGVCHTPHQTFVLMKTSSKDIFKTSSRRLYQDEHLPLGHRSSEDVSKTSSRRLGQDQYIRLGHKYWRHFQDVLLRHFQDILKTSSRHLQDIFKTSCQDVFKTFSERLHGVFQKRLQYIFKTSSRRLAKISSRRFKDVSSNETVLVNKSLVCIQHVSNTYCKDGYLQKDLPRSHFWEIYGQCTKLAREIKISQNLVFHFNTF